MFHWMKKSPYVKPTRTLSIDNNFLRLAFYAALFLVIVVVIFVIGIMIGYSVIGDGNPIDVLNWNTWQHILDFLK